MRELNRVPNLAFLPSNHGLVTVLDLSINLRWGRDTLFSAVVSLPYRFTIVLQVATDVFHLNPFTDVVSLPSDWTNQL